MTRWPDFFIVGAARSGTTSLYSYLRGHPDIFMPSVKEPHFFLDMDAQSAMQAQAARGIALPVGTIRREENYLHLFEGVAPGQVAGEASVSYLAYHATAGLIREKNPHAKIVAVLREPIDRAYSAYLLGLREGREQKSSFYEALQEDHDSMTGASNERSVYIWPGLYYEQVKRYIDVFGKEPVRIFLYEDLESDTTALVKDLCCFLGVPFYDGNFFNAHDKLHTYGAPRNALFKWVSRSRTARSLAAAVAPMHMLIPLRDRLVDRQQPKPQLDPQAREFLRGIYHDDIVKLQELIGADLRAWLT